MSPSTSSSTLRFGPFRFDTEADRLHRGDVIVHLTPRAVAVLKHLLERPGEVISKDNLFDAVWKDVHVTEEALTQVVSAIRLALGDNPHSPEYIHTVPREGYRFIGKVTRSAAQPTSRVGSAVRRMGPITAAALGAVATLVLFLLLNPGGSRDRLLRAVEVAVDPTEVRVLAVMPPSFSGDPDQKHLADGMNDALNAELGRIAAIQVKASRAARQYAARPLSEIGSGLGVSGVVETSMILDGGEILITASLSHAASETQLWSNTYLRTRDDVLSLVRSVARDIATQIEVELTEAEQQRLATAPRPHPQAQDAYFRGRVFCNSLVENPAGFQQAVEHLTQATEIQPAFAEAWAALAACYALRGFSTATATYAGGEWESEDLARVKEAAFTAINLDDALPEAHAALGLAEFFADWDFFGPEEHFQRSIALNDSLADSRLYYATYLVLSGRPEEAIAENQEAIDLDPATPLVSNNLAWVYAMGHRFDDGIAHVTKSLERSPGDSEGRRHLAVLYAFKEEYSNAVRLCDETRWSDCAWIYAVAGEHNKAREMLPELGSAVGTAVVYGALGEMEEALLSLDEAYRERDPWFVLIEMSPQMDTLRSDGGFQLRLSGLRAGGSEAAETEGAAEGPPGEQPEELPPEQREPSGTGAMIARTLGPGGAPLQGVEFHLEGPRGTNTQLTGSDGNARILNLAPGSYTATFALDGFKTVVRDGLRITAGRTVTVTVRMERSLAYVQACSGINASSPTATLNSPG